MKCQYFLKNSEFIECKGEECPMYTQDMACQHTIITLTVYEKEDGGRVLEIKKQDDRHDLNKDDKGE